MSCHQYAILVCTAFLTRRQTYSIQDTAFLGSSHVGNKINERLFQQRALYNLERVFLQAHAKLADLSLQRSPHQIPFLVPHSIFLFLWAMLGHNVKSLFFGSLMQLLCRLVPFIEQIFFSKYVAEELFPLQFFFLSNYKNRDILGFVSSTVFLNLSDSILCQKSTCD